MSQETLGEPADFQLRKTGEILLVTFHGPKLPHEVGIPLIQLVDEEGHGKLVLNFENVRVLTSAPIGILISLKKKTSSMGGSVHLCRLKPDVLEILQLTHVANLFEIYDDEETAINSFSA